MTSLAREDTPPELLNTIQGSLHSDEVIRHCALCFRVETDTDFVYDHEGDIIGEQQVGHVASVFHLAVTDTLLAFRSFPTDWVLTDQQRQEKHALESEVFKRWPLKGQKRYSEIEVRDLLVAKHGRLRFEYLPQVVWSQDIQIADITLNEFAEDTPAPFVLDYFGYFYTHQKDQICYFQYSGTEWSQYVSSFFGNLHDIYLHIRDVKANARREAASVSKVTKCTSCGSTELTVRGAYTVCDYCQSKFGR